MAGFEFKPDYEEAFERHQAWWDDALGDRPLIDIQYPKPSAQRLAEPPPKSYKSLRERWMDFDARAQAIEATMANRVYFADAMPAMFPNLGPEIFSAFYGCPMEYSETTAWSEPIIEDFSDESIARVQLDLDGLYFKAVMEFTDRLLERARGRFIVGYTDLHPGADALAAFRDPEGLALDLLLWPDGVKRLNERVTGEFLRVFDIFYDKLSAAGMPSASWLPGIGRGKFHIPSNDFSCMISAEMFEEFFVPGIIRECQHMDRNIYHLDGPGALRYLDRLLEIPEIRAIQWVPGAGNPNWRDSLEVYRRIQAAGRGFWLTVAVSELDEFTEALRPRGAWVCVEGVADEAMARQALKKLEVWR